VTGSEERLIKLDARHARHSHVGNEAGHGGAARPAEKALGVFIGGGGEASRPQQILSRIADRLVVVHDGDQRAFGHFASRN
jgi:hypothetical protein